MNKENNSNPLLEARYEVFTEFRVTVGGKVYALKNRHHIGFSLDEVRSLKYLADGRLVDEYLIESVMFGIPCKELCK